MIANVTNLGGNSAVLTFDQKVDLVKRCIYYSLDGWDLLVKSMKNSGVGSARVQYLSIFRKIAKDKGTSNTETQEIFNELVITLDKHLSKI